MKPHTEKFLKQRKFLIALPILVLPFLTMIFWALGGGQGTPAQAQEINHTGLNPDLPGARFSKDEVLWDKFELYEQAKRNAIKYEEARKNDPYYVMTTLEVATPDTVGHDQSQLNTSLTQKDPYSALDKDEAAIQQKLEALTRQLQGEIAAPEKQPAHTPHPQSLPSTPPSETDSDIDRLEEMMQMIGESGGSDPEMAQINEVLEKILDIQHPERVKERLGAHTVAQKKAALPVTTTGDATAEDNSLKEYLHPEPVANGFFGLEEDANGQDQGVTAIEAVIHQTQTVVAGATIKMRLLSDVNIADNLIEQGSFVYGVCALQGERLTITINAIRKNNALLPVSLSAHDLDGLEGLYIPGAIARDAAKQASSDAMQDVQLYSSLDPSIGMQAAGAGIEAAKGLFSKKAKLIKVTLKAGYKILLKDNSISR